MKVIFKAVKWFLIFSYLIMTIFLTNKSTLIYIYIYTKNKFCYSNIVTNYELLIQCLTLEGGMTKKSIFWIWKTKNNFKFWGLQRKCLKIKVVKHI